MEQATCPNCGNYGKMKRKIGIWSWLLVFFTSGLWLVAIYFYPKRCAKCKKSPVIEKSGSTKWNNLSSGSRIGIVSATFFALMMVMLASMDPMENRAPQREVSDFRSLCGTNTQCYKANVTFFDRMSFNCETAIERLAKYDYDWETTFGDKFPGVAWIDEAKTMLLFSGDKIRFQNGFGAWASYHYYCQVRASDASLIGIFTDQGRL